MNYNIEKHWLLSIKNQAPGHEHSLFFYFIGTMKKLAVFLAILATFCLAEEEKGMWQKFVDFFSPSSSVKGDSELEQSIKKLEKKIQATKNDYNREHRPQRKSMLKREIEDLTHEKDSLMTVLETRKSISSSSVKGSSSSAIASSSSEQAKIESSSTAMVTQPVSIPQPAEHCDTIWVIEKRVVHDTVFIHDSVFVHDTIYVQKNDIQ